MKRKNSKQKKHGQTLKIPDILDMFLFFLVENSGLRISEHIGGGREPKSGARCDAGDAGDVPVHRLHAEKLRNPRICTERPWSPWTSVKDRESMTLQIHLASKCSSHQSLNTSQLKQTQHVIGIKTDFATFWAKRFFRPNHVEVFY